MIIRILAVFLTSHMFIGCSSLNRADSHKMLEKRAEYERKIDLSSGDKKKARIYIFPHRLSNGDSFSGGWIVTEIPGSPWIQRKVEKR